MAHRETRVRQKVLQHHLFGDDARPNYVGGAIVTLIVIGAIAVSSYVRGIAPQPTPETRAPHCPWCGAPTQKPSLPL